jgi:hypothetical protein
MGAPADNDNVKLSVTSKVDNKLHPAACKFNCKARESGQGGDKVDGNGDQQT